MCVVIFSGKRRNPVVELRIDTFAEEIGTELDEDYIIKNSGLENQFPSDPVCVYQNKPHTMYL